MTTPPETPDCILSLRDGSMVAASSGTMAKWLQSCATVPHIYNLPVYSVDEMPETVQLLKSICDSTIDISGPTPPWPTVAALAGLSSNHDLMHMCGPYIEHWLRRWIQSDQEGPKAEVLYTAMMCRNRDIVLGVYRDIVLGSCSEEEMCRADYITDHLPEPRTL